MGDSGARLGWERAVSRRGRRHRAVVRRACAAGMLLVAAFGWARVLTAAQFTVVPGEVLILLPDAVAERATVKQTPRYPAIAKAAKVEGIVRLAVRITEAG